MTRSNWNNKRKYKVNQLLQEFWDKRGSLYLHKDQPSIKGKNAFVPKLCHCLGFCVCGKSKRSCPNALKVFLNIQPFFRRMFHQKKKVKTRLRELLDDCKVFIKLTAFHRDDMDPNQALPEDVFAYIGFINRKTWHFSALYMDMIPDDEGANVWEPENAPPGTVMLSSPECPDDVETHLVTDLQLFERALHFEFSYKLSLFRLLEQEGAWEPMNSNCQRVPACPCVDDEPFIVWHGSAQQNKRKRKALSITATAASEEDRILRMLENEKPRQKKSRPENWQSEPNSEHIPLDPLDVSLFDNDDDDADDDNKEPQTQNNDPYWSGAENDNDSQDELTAAVEERCDNERNERESNGSNSESPGILSESEFEDNTADAPEIAGDLKKDNLQDPADKKQLLNRFFGDSDVALQGETVTNAIASPSAEILSPLPVPDPNAEPKPEPCPAAGHVRASSARDRVSTQTLAVPGSGLIRFLPQSNVLVAVCDHPGHGDCRRQKTVTGSNVTTARGQGQGRPLGFLASWLRQQCDFDDRSGHVKWNPSFETRQQARQWLFLNCADAEEFSRNYERALRDGEAPEPVAI